MHARVVCAVAQPPWSTFPQYHSLLSFNGMLAFDANRLQAATRSAHMHQCGQTDSHDQGFKFHKATKSR